MTNPIMQGSEAWLEAKQKTIGGSEIYTLVYHYCRSELEALGFSNQDLIKDRPFRTVQELFLKVYFNAKLDDIEPVHKVFGNSMEEYIARRLEQEMPEIMVERTKDFIATDGLASSSPDARITIRPGCQFYDYDTKVLIDGSWGVGGGELKTSTYFSQFSKGGTRLQYIFQNQHNMMLDEDLNFGILTAINPKEKEMEIEGVKFTSDSEFAKCRSYMWAMENKFDLLDQLYDLQIYVYPKLPAFQALIIKALELFARDLEAYKNGDQNCFPRNSEDISGLQREKRLWGQLWSEHAGVKKLSGNDELDHLLNERYKYQEAKMFAEQDLENIQNEIFQKVKAENLDKYCEIIGTEHRLLWIKNGQTRFYKLGKNND